MRITGKTRIMFILGDPVEHIVGTAMLNDYFAAEGLDVAVSPLHVAPDDLPAVVATLRKLRNVAGFGVTIPHKIAVIPLLDATTETARHVGAVNFVRRSADGTLTGDNVDGRGFVAGLAANGVTVAGRRVLQIGAGGAGRAIAFALAEAGAAELAIVNRSAEKGAALARAVAAAVPGCAASGRLPPLGEVDLVVNTTSLGMKAVDPLPLDLAGLVAATTVAEVVMTPEKTPLLVEAEARGCPIVGGREMMKHQIALARAFVGL